MESTAGQTQPTALLRLFASLFLTLLYGVLLLNSYWGLGFPIVNSAYVASLVLLYPNLRNKPESLFYLGAGLVLSFFLAFRAFELGRVLTILTVFLLNSLAVSRSSSHSDEPLTLQGIIIAPATIALRSVFEISSWFDHLRSRRAHSPVGSGMTLTQGLRGALIALPLILLVSFLLVSADPLFAKFFFNLIPNVSLNAEILRTGVELFFAFSIASSLLRPLAWKKGEITIFSSERYKTEIAMASIALGVLIGLFILVQINYLFAGEKLISDLGLTASEYTRKGFGELVAVSAICLTLVLMLLGEKGASVLPARAISAVFLIEIAFLLLSATRRVYLYQDAFGFTQRRLLGFLFSLWLGATLVIFFGRLLRLLQEKNVVRSLFLNYLGVLFLLNAVNIDYTVGVVKQPNLGYGVDYSYIAALSTDAWPAWGDSVSYLEKAEGCGWKELQGAASLVRQKSRLSKRSQAGWHNAGAWTSSGRKALLFLEKNAGRLDSLREKFIARCGPYYFEGL